MLAQKRAPDFAFGIQALLALTGRLRSKKQGGQQEPGYRFD